MPILKRLWLQLKSVRDRIIFITILRTFTFWKVCVESGYCLSGRELKGSMFQNQLKFERAEGCDASLNPVELVCAAGIVSAIFSV